MAITLKQARMALQELRDRRSAVDLIDELLFKADEAEARINSAKSEMGSIEQGIENFKKLRADAQAEFEKSKAAMNDQQNLAANESAKLKKEIQELTAARDALVADIDKRKADAEADLATIVKAQKAKEAEIESAKVKVAKMLEGLK